MSQISSARRIAVRTRTLLKRFIRDEVAFLPRRLDSAERGLPDYLILGAMKCGTTSLSFYLSQNPHNLSAYRKEIRYFDRRFHRGEAWYKAHFPRLSTIEAKRQSMGARVITGEATPNYLFHPRVPWLLHEAVPEARLIAILRNPIERAFSHYNHNRRAERTLGQIPEPLSFMQALEAEETRIEGKRDQMLSTPGFDSTEYLQFSYMNQGVYVDQLAAFTELFGRERLLVLRSEDFYSNPQNILDSVADFLEVGRHEIPDLAAKNVNQYSNMDPEARRFMERFFAPHNRHLYEFLGRDMEWS